DDEGEDKEEEEYLSPADSVPPLAYHTTARMSIQAQTPIPFLSEAEVDRLLVIPTPPPSPLAPLSFVVGECSFVPTARPTKGFRTDYGFVGTLDAKIRHKPDREIGYRITDLWEDPDEIDTYEIYGRLDEAHDDILLMSGQLNLLVRDRRSHARTTRLMESEAGASREDWVQSMDASDMTHSKVKALQTTVLAHQTEIGDLREADRRRQKMAPMKRTTRASPATTTTTTPVTNVQLKALMDQGVVDALASRDANRSQNGDDNHNLGKGSRRT
nr:hypothetical protein [Tanacetum cinerariifolium]